mgnify:CR=1 FL=1
MNRNCYRLVFNRQRNAWLAVAETVRGSSKRNARRSSAPAAAVVLGLVMALAGSALAGPTIPPANALPVPSSGARPFVFAGSVNGGQPSVTGSAMTITTPSRALGLNWASFNIGSDASLTFNQPDATSRVLNRIWSADPSVIMGRLNANGEVYLINQNGILFGNGAQVNVGGLIASALNLSDSMVSQLLNSGLPSVKGDRLEFAWDGSAAGFNAGFITLDTGARISTPSGGRVLLIAPKTVENLGLIEGGGGAEAILGAGGKVILTAPDDPNLRGLLVETKSFTGKDSLGNNVSLDGSVTNKGTIDSGSGGVVTLAALAVNQKGIVNASKAVNLNGTTMLVSGSTETNRLTVNQRGDRAEIDWVSGFNVGAGKRVEFVQPASGAVVYNHVYDPDRTAADGSVLNVAGRSSIDGTLKANGQLLLINEKGIDFGADARVSASNFVASALGINPDVAASGLLLQDGVSARAFYLNKTPSVDSPVARLAALEAFRQSTVEVKAGASIESASNGYVILAGGKVKQDGTITTPQGQTLLAAGADLYLKPAYAQAVRGFSAEVNPLYVIGADTAGIVNPWIALSRGSDANAVSNSGRIMAALGNISLAGHEITQAGTLLASTSVTTNGSINLLARDQVNDRGAGAPIAIKSQRKLDGNGIAAVQTNETYNSSDKANEPEFTSGKVGGTLTLAAGSSTKVVLDGSDGKTLGSDQPFISSLIDSAAKQIVVADASGTAAGALVEAKGGRIGLRSSESFDPSFSAFAVDPVSVDQASSAMGGVGIFIGTGSRIDASGVVAQKSVADLFIKVELRGDEFAGNPVQRNGTLRGKTAWVDIRDDVKIADLSGWFARVGQSLEEKATSGGSISLRSAGSVIVKPDAELDVSGGGIAYAGGRVTESRVLSVGGKAFRLNDAPTSAKYYGMRERNRTLADYYEGRSAGTLELIAHSLAVDGKLFANTTRGPRQRNVGGSANIHYAVPLGGKLIIRDAGQHFPVADRYAADEEEKMREYTEAQIAFVKGAANASAGLQVGDSAGRRLELSQTLVDAGFSRFDIRSDGRIDVGADVALKLAPGGEITLAGRQVYVAGDIGAPNGKISLTSRDMSTAAGLFPTESDAKYSTLVVDQGALLSTAGQWVNDYLDRQESSRKPKAISGGSISLVSAHDIDLRAGSQLNVSGGALVNSKGKLEAGNAGSIVLTSGGVGKSSGAGYNFLSDGDRRDASLFLDGTLAAYALGSGGTLELNTSAVQLGDRFVADSRDWSRSKRLSENQVGVALTPDFFNASGFYDFKLVGRDGVTVQDGTRIAAQPLNWSLAGLPGYRRKSSGSDLGSFAASLVLHPDLRSSATDLTLATRSLNFGDLLVGDDAYLGVAPKGSINLESRGQLSVLGTLEAPAGNIKLSRPANRTSDPSNVELIAYSEAKQSESIYLGADSRLLAAGTSVLGAPTRLALEAGVSADALRALRRYKGEILPGGTVDIDAGLGYLIARSGSLIDVQGASGTLNSATSLTRGISYLEQTLGSAGGSISLAARDGLFLDGSYRAAGGRNALGGTFSLRHADAQGKSDPWDATPPAQTPVSPEVVAVLGKRELALYQSGGLHNALWPSAIATSDYLAGSATLDPVQFNGKAALDLALLQSAGFGSWYLASQDAMRFSGSIAATVNNQLRLDAPRLSASNDASRLALKAAAVQIGTYTSSGTPAVATIGNAQASIEALDIGLVGAFTWDGFGSTRLVSRGEIHFDSVNQSAPLRSGARLFAGQMNTTGNLELSAARLSPSTYSDFRVDLLSDPAGRIAITRPAGASADVSLSPAGRLEFAAASIDHQGTVTAPLGEIVFNAPAGSVTLGASSLTSVAANRDLLLGNTIESGSKWNYQGVSWQPNGSIPVAGSSQDNIRAPGKSIRIDAAQSTIASGARLDLSAGGDAVAWEFTAGPGGKTDILRGSPTEFAIVPNWNGFSATDSQLQQFYNVSATGSSSGSTYSQVPSLKAGDRIALATNPAGISGPYVLLPARYALLPGAYLVTVKTASDDVLRATKTLADGSWLVAGTRLAVNADGSATPYSQRALTLELASSSVTAKRARYLTTTASEFFYDHAGARLPGDAGQLTVIGRSSLAFDPSIVAMRQAEISAADGRKRAGQGLEVDLAAPRLLISDAGTAPDASWSLIDQNKLNALGAASLLLGGVRTIDGATTRIETIASQVHVHNNGVANAQQALRGPELMLSATNEVKLAAGSRIEASGDAIERSVTLDGDGAFLRAAAGNQAMVTRAGTVSRTQGNLLLTSGASVAGRSLVFDATNSTILSGTVALGTLQADSSRSGGYLALGAGRINIVGDSTIPADGLSLDSTALVRFALADQLRLTSYTTLDLYGNVLLGTAELKELVIGAAGIAGHGSGTAKIAAQNVVFDNPNPGASIFSAGAPLGSGALQVVAETIRFGSNATAPMRGAETSGFDLRGFAAVNLAAAGDLLFSGRGVSAVNNIGGSGAAAALAVSAARIATIDTADHLLVASGNASVTASGRSSTEPTGLGGVLELRARAIDVSGRIETPAGKLTLAAAGTAAADNVSIQNGAVLAADGVKVAFADTAAYAPGGQIVLRAARGNVDVRNGAVVSVSAAPEGGDAGRLRLEAKDGTVSAAAGSLRASANSADSATRGGELTVDANAVALDTLTAAVEQTTADGPVTHFTGAWDVRRRNGDLNLSRSIKSADVTIAADNGSVSVGASGKIDASGAKGGNIQLFSRNGDVHLAGQLLARATDRIDNASNAGTRGQGGSVLLAADGSGKVFTATGSGIDVGVADGSLASGGKVNLRAGASASIVNAADLNVQLAGTINGASDVGAEIVSKYIGSSLIAGTTSGTTLGLTSIRSALNSLYSAGNMATLRGHLGFGSPLYHVRAGVDIGSATTADFNLGASAADLDFSSLRFAGEAGVLTVRAQGNLNINGTLSDGFANATRDAALTTSGPSWSYRLVAGADPAAASPLATKATAPTGSIVLATNKLVRTGTGTIDLAARRDIKLLDRAAIYTAGVAASTHPTGFTPSTATTAGTLALFPDGGGDLSLTAGERIVMTKATTAVAAETAPDPRHINQWLLRTDPTSDLQWWPRIPSFQQGVAAFGGGDIALAAGTEIRNFTTVIPSNARVPTIGGERQPDLAVVQGGGDLTVGADGMVTGGLFYAETGRLRIDAAALASNVNIALGNTSARVVAAGNVALGGIFNPMWAQQRAVASSGSFASGKNTLLGMRIGTYGPESSFNVVSVAGNLALNGGNTVLNVTDKTHSLAPSQFKAVALNGNITGGVIQAPGAKGQLDLLAAGSINFNNQVAKQLDVPAAALPSVRNPIEALNFDLAGVLDFTGGTPIEKHSSTGWHADDSEPSRLVALRGDISGDPSARLSFADFNEAVRIEARGTISNLRVVAQHNHSKDVSVVAAGGGISYKVDGGSVPPPAIELSGPGRLEVSAGGSIELSDTTGIVTRGNLNNPYLPESGASIFALAGGTPDYSAFRDYLKVGSEVSEADLRQRFYVLLRDFGRAAEAGGGEASYEKGRVAIRALFPQKNINGGDINLFASQIKTEQGGGIDLLAPGGSVVVGVADPSIKKRSALQGLFTLRDGDIRAYVKNNFLVNQSRVFTLDGGNILVWADTGSIDAGSGAKTVSSTPPPALVIRNGQIVLDTSNSVSGSGIGALASRDDTPASDIDLFAPKGAIDAGDAGLRSTGNITLGAQTILNASNIQAAGTVSGAPAPAASAVPVAIPASPATTEKGDAQAASALASNRESPLGILTVEVLESGEAAAEPASEKDEEKKKKR